MRIRTLCFLLLFLYVHPIALHAQESPAPLPAAPAPKLPPATKSAQAASSAAVQVPVSPPVAADPENRHVRILRFKIADGESLNLPKLEKESLLLCLQCGMLRRIPEGGNGEPWETGPGSALWNRGGNAYSIENHGPGSSELLLLELKDSYAISQIRVPYSERDPLLVDSVHFRVVLENEHVRVLLLHLKPRDGTDESQFASRVEIALNDLRADESLAGGKLTERTLSFGEAAWKESQLKTIINAGEKPLDEVIVELKHPFCYRVEYDDARTDKNPELKKYFSDVKAKIAKHWLKKMPAAARDGSTGLVSLEVKLEPDGSVLEDGILFHEVFASDSLVQKGIRAVRDASPFTPVPKSWDKAMLSFSMVFLYNLPLTPQPGCHE